MELAKTLPHFEHIYRFWDKQREIAIAKIHPGEVYVSKNNELVSTLLGSCVAVCIRDKVNRVGGMNHFKLPSSSAVSTMGDYNYGNFAMEKLINEILKNGGNRHCLEAKVFGGGNVLQQISSGIGEKNITFVLEYLKNEKIPVVMSDMGHTSAQTIYFHPIAGTSFTTVQGKASREEVKKEEELYLSSVKNTMDELSVTYF